MKTNDQSVTAGIPDFAFSCLDLKTKRLVRKFAARVSEASYRRGLQHGFECADRLQVRPAHLRFDIGLSRSRNAMHRGSISAEERLDEQYWLTRLGLGELL